jgi:hypothetical protein
MTQAVNHKMNNNQSGKQMSSSIYPCLPSFQFSKSNIWPICLPGLSWPFLPLHYRLKPINVCELEPWEIVYQENV